MGVEKKAKEMMRMPRGGSRLDGLELCHTHGSGLMTIIEPFCPDTTFVFVSPGASRVSGFTRFWKLVGMYTESSAYLFTLEEVHTP